MKTLILALVIATLTGCGTVVTMSHELTKKCRNEECRVLTPGEMREIYLKGYDLGVESI